jgi:hypothetical protein
MPGKPLVQKKKWNLKMKMTKKQAKISKVMGEFKEGTLHSSKGSKVVKSPKQAIAIAISEASKKGRYKK